MKPGLVLTDRRTGLPSVRFAGAPLLRPRYLLRHTFSGAGLTPSDQGPSLSVESGTANISGGVVAPSSATALEIANYASVAVNAVWEARFNFGNSAGTARIFYMRIRQNGNDSVWVRHDRTNDRIRIDRIDNSVVTQVGVKNAAGLADSTWYVTRVIAQGDSYRVLFGPDTGALSEIIAATFSGFSTNGGLGVILADNVASPTLQLDRYEVWTP